VATLANQIHHGPVALAHLDVVEVQPNQFRPAKATPKQHSQHGVIALRSHGVSPRMPEHFGTLLHAQPIARPESELLHSSHAANPRSQLGTQQTRVGGFVSEATHGGKLLVDRVSGQTSRFQIHAIAHDDDAVKGEPWFRAIPGYELVDGIFVYPSRPGRPEAVEYCCFAVI
jgi:hypothetical protein